MILVVTLILLVMFYIVWSAAAQKQDEKLLVCMDDESREAIRVIMQKGIDEALVRHTIQMFNTWMKDPTEQPNRAITGMRNAVKAYIGSRKVVLTWNPPLCN